MSIRRGFAKLTVSRSGRAPAGGRSGKHRSFVGKTGFKSVDRRGEALSAGRRRDV